MQSLETETEILRDRDIDETWDIRDRDSKKRSLGDQVSRLHHCYSDPLLYNRSGSGEGAIALPKTYEGNFIQHDFLQFGKQHSRYKAVLPSIVLSQQFCDV